MGRTDCIWDLANCKLLASRSAAPGHHPAPDEIQVSNRIENWDKEPGNVRKNWVNVVGFEDAH
jgi:hypothetical protein